MTEKIHETLSIGEINSIAIILCEFQNDLCISGFAFVILFEYIPFFLYSLYEFSKESKFF